LGQDGWDNTAGEDKQERTTKEGKRQQDDQKNDLKIIKMILRFPKVKSQKETL
jgi:hypothetical protein